jgi:hypothetical protein
LDETVRKVIKEGSERWDIPKLDPLEKEEEDFDLNVDDVE